MKSSFLSVPVVLAASLLSFSVANSALAAGNNNSPPAGAILDLAGGETGTAAQAVNHSSTSLKAESVSFTAAVANTDITLAFREDPAFLSVGNISLINNTTGSVNLLVNGNFATGTIAGWNYVNIYGASAGGQVSSCSAFASGYCWYDGAVQAYDAIDQVVATTIGDVYTLSFDYWDNGPLNVFQDLSTNGNTTGPGGNGIDILVYAQAGLPVACQPGVICTNNSVPEPASIALLGLGMAGLGFSRRKKKA